ncbi:MAG: FMN-binding negative transcriptional regulator [Nocardiopsaceae bacterium]|jgi:transcriptional regulator|nr:FMN-binding negative transcriptional regulator [Nocardiopsaceae bacterium]
MYVPAHFAAHDQAQIAAFVDQAGAADLVTFDGTRLVSTLLPVIWERNNAGNGRLIGHIALTNPQWRDAVNDVPALAIFHGPQAYISPSWYQSTKEHGRTVPTWNYTTVHMSGPVTFHRDDAWLENVVTMLTERHEAGRPERWRVEDAPPAFIAGQLRAIVGVEMTVQQIEAKDKLSQNRTPRDRAGVISALRTEAAAGAQAIAELMASRESVRASAGDPAMG